MTLSRGVIRTASSPVFHFQRDLEWEGSTEDAEQAIKECVAAYCCCGAIVRIKLEFTVNAFSTALQVLAFLPVHSTMKACRSPVSGQLPV